MSTLPLFALLPRAAAFCGMLALASADVHCDAVPYDPLVTNRAVTVETMDFTIHDAARGRDIPIRVYARPAGTRAPLLLFSHGLGGSRENNPYLGEHWAARGYVAVFLQHPGSDESVWRERPAGEGLAALQAAANLENFLLRADDVPAVLDQLAAWDKEDGHPLARRLDLSRVGMSGHSFGAVTTQAVSGQTFRLRRGVGITDPRIDAACAFSPSAPRMGDPETAFGSVEIPWMLMTGTEDEAPIGNIDVESRLAVYPALPPGGKYELVLFGAEHSAFGDRALPGDREARNPNHHRAIRALSTAFWDAWVKEDPAARAWLDGDGPATVLEEDDRWQRK